MKIATLLTFVIFIISVYSPLNGYTPPGFGNEGDEEPPATFRSDCAPAKGQKDLAINRVRARILTGGDKWWNLNNARYVVPTPTSGQPEVSSIFAAGLWLGGFDEEGNLKLAAQTYRAHGRSDWWPGPLNEDGFTDSNQCNDWDIVFRVTEEDVRKQRKNIQQYSQLGLPIPKELVPENILYWPAEGNPFFSEKYGFSLPNRDIGLAPFFDLNDDGLYNPVDGDFPVLGLENCLLSVDTRIPDEMLFWIFNDAGGIHTNSGGDLLNVEFRAQAFAFDAGDELDHMTFYRYQIVNRGHGLIDSTYIGLWIDFDLGCPFNDYIGSYPDLDLAFAYNMDEFGGLNQGCECGSIPTYCDHIPAIGVNLLRGPLNDQGEYLGMNHFMLYNNRTNYAGPISTTDPTNATEYYRYLTGHFRDGRPLTIGGDGYRPAGGTKTNFAFPGNPSDPDAWTMCSEDLGPGDRRSLISTGPLKFYPGSINEIIYGVPFVLDVDYPCPDLTRLFEVTKKTRTLFDQCFQLGLRGPDAPEMVVSRTNDAFSVVLKNDFPGSNNRNQDYREKATFIPDDAQDHYYEFEGYIVYQLRSGDLPLTHKTFNNPDLAIPVFQSDLENDVDIIYNWTRYENPSYYLARPIFIPELMVDGANTGIESNFVIDRDMFDQSGDGLLHAGQD
ncbi:MAG: hypothetical protein EA362_09620, partial [Saprospirales bacterium]